MNVPPSAKIYEPRFHGQKPSQNIFLTYCSFVFFTQSPIWTTETCPPKLAWMRMSSPNRLTFYFSCYKTNKTLVISTYSAFSDILLWKLPFTATATKIAICTKPIYKCDVSYGVSLQLMHKFFQPCFPVVRHNLVNNSLIVPEWNHHLHHEKVPNLQTVTQQPLHMDEKDSSTFILAHYASRPGLAFYPP